MAKIEQYFNSQAELEAYYPNGVPSTVLAIVKNENNGVSLYTYDNNVIAGGGEIGGETISKEDKELVTNITIGFREMWIISDSGHEYQMNRIPGEGYEETYTIDAKDMNWDFPAYIEFYDEVNSWNLYPEEDIVYTDGTIGKKRTLEPANNGSSYRINPLRDDGHINGTIKILCGFVDEEKTEPFAQYWFEEN